MVRNSSLALIKTRITLGNNAFPKHEWRGMWKEENSVFRGGHFSRPRHLFLGAFHNGIWNVLHTTLSSLKCRAVARRIKICIERECKCWALDPVAYFSHSGTETRWCFWCNTFTGALHSTTLKALNYRTTLQWKSASLSVPYLFHFRISKQSLGGKHVTKEIEAVISSGHYRIIQHGN